MPGGFETLAGPAPELAGRFGLHEHPSEDYPERTELNVRSSDGTLWFGARSRSRWELYTYRFIHRQQ